MNVSKVALAVSAVFMLSACGGGGSNDSNTGVSPVVPEETPPAHQVKTLSVTVIDGYLEGATVWLDKKSDQNYQPDADEPRTTTNEKGIAVFDNIESLSLDDYVLVAKATAGKTIDHDNGKTVSSTFYLTAPTQPLEAVASRNSSELALQASVVTPLTTLVEMKLRQQQASAGESSLIAAINQLAGQLGISAENAEILLSDFKKLSSADAAKAEQAAISLVAAGAMPATITEMAKQADDLLAFAELVSTSVKQAAADEIVITDGLDGVRTVKTTDSDEDGVIDELDAFPDDAEEWYDSDDDGVGNNRDHDDDDDGVFDDDDAFPLNPHASHDLDNDSIDDASDLDMDGDGKDNEDDPDSDNDGTANGDDAFPLDPKEDTDTDGDKIGNNQDSDDDGDGYDDNEDNEPLQPLDVPESLTACLDSLPDFPEGEAVSDSNNGRVYHVTRINHGTDTPVEFIRSESSVGQRDGLPDGVDPERSVDVTQVVTNNPNGEVGLWNPGFELMYTDADTHQYLGTEDVFRRWWSLITASSLPVDLKLNELETGWIERLDHYSPQVPAKHENVSSVYLGKEIIDTPLGHREVCIVKQTSELELVDRTLVPDEMKRNSIYIEEEIKQFLDKERLVVRSEKNYLEYSLEDRETPTWGYTDQVQQLTGMVQDGQLYGQNPATAFVTEGQPATMEQCLAELPDAGYASQVNDTLHYEIYRRGTEKDISTNQDVTIKQIATYDFNLLVDPDTSWSGHDSVRESSITGQFLDLETRLPYYTFHERYFENTEGLHLGFEATQNGGTDIAWGNEIVSHSRQSAAGGYRLPEVYHSEGVPLNPTSERARFRHVEAVVYSGKEMTADFATGDDIPACKRYSRWEVQFFKADGALLLDENNKPVTEYSNQVEWRDNRGVINRDSNSHKWDYESWRRSGETLN